MKGSIMGYAKFASAISVLIVVSTISMVVTAQDERRYGKCFVSSHVDDFTDKVSHIISCSGGVGESRLSDKSYLLLSCSKGRPYEVALHPGEIQVHLDNTIKIQYRFDKKKLKKPFIPWIWHIEGQVASSSHGKRIFNDFLHNMAVAKRLVFQVGKKRATVNFDGQTSNAANDFSQRCGTLRTG